jgi:hypothetical protein
MAKDMRRGDRLAEVRNEFRAPGAAGVAGLLFAASLITSLLLVGASAGMSAEQLAEWYSGTARSTLVLVGLYLIPVAGVAFLWFIGAVRDRVGDKEDRFFSTVFLGSGLLFVAMLFAAAAMASALAIRFESLGAGASAAPSEVAMAQAFTYAFLYVYAARSAGVFMIVTSTIAWRTQWMPKWISIVGLLIAAVLLLSLRSFQTIILLFPLWVALVSVFILSTARRHSATSASMEEDSGEATTGSNG